MSNRIKNKNLVESIIYTISKMTDEAINEKYKEIIELTLPQFKMDLASLWNDFDFETQKRIAKILPDSWKWDIHMILTETK